MDPGSGRPEVLNYQVDIPSPNLPTYYRNERNEVLYVDPRSRAQPREADIWGKMTKTNSINILPFRGWGLDKNNYITRMYSDFGSFGDFDKYVFDMNTKPELLVPEPLIYYFAWCILNACIFMEFGPESHEGTWTPIVHRDIKPQNIILTEAKDGIAEQFGWPTFQLIDWGGACEPSDPMFDNPRDFTTTGTFGFRAPEGYRFYGPEIYREKITPKADIYSLGVMLWRLMNPQDHPWGPRLGHERLHGGHQEEHVSELRWSHRPYSDLLKLNVLRCLRFWPDSRPTARALKCQVEAELLKYAEKGYWRSPGDLAWPFARLKYPRFHVGGSIDAEFFAAR
ncbi:kinase-like protein [Tothia fuscella]|uniref:Kinase-like protein n=1 Tax=Tothia fuscella TaxID=1048955 RepID=A0A9P4NIA1_9PEZI|nr:kinase-like protein [Tothia fuscella]